MTYPNPSYPPQAQPGYPPQPQAPYQPAQPSYPPQPQAPGYPPQGYPQQPTYPPQATYPPQGYGQPGPGPQAPPPPRTGVAEYLEQPSLSGQSLKFEVPGTQHTGIVARDLGDGDFPPQMEMDKVTPKKFRDGRVMVRMVVPLIVRPDPQHPDGRASLNVQGQMSEALKQAMAAVGAGHLNGIPEAGAEITVAWVNSVPAKTAGFNPQKIYSVVYKRPAGAAGAPQDNGQAAQGNGQAPQQAAPGQPYVPAGQQPQYPAPQQGQFMPPEQFQNAQQGQPQWPAPGAPLSVPPQPAPPGENPYAQPYNAQAGMQQFAPEMQHPQQPPAPQMPGQPGPAARVAAAQQAGVAAAQQAQAPQGPPAMAPPPGMHPYTAALMKQVTGTTLTPQEQAALAAGPPQ